MWFMEKDLSSPCRRFHAETQQREAVAAQAHIAVDAKARKRRAEAKKKARRTIDAPSNKTLWQLHVGLSL
jgi:hypothetical protein